MTTPLNSKFPHYWICDACAKERGGVWPENQCATIASKICEYCNGKSQIEPCIAPWVDYDWPKNIERDLFAKVSRD